ncbi:MAG: site-specific DNA-methyltransferase [Bacteroidaceae bacterium]|nr:site-specific DNA-methyltransferase [Bacteroidaceae bacterium]
MAMNYYDKFVAKLQEIFMMDHAELDFGIYRIMNQKRDEINHFLQVDLLPQVKQALQGDAGNTQQAKQRMAEIEQMFAGMDIETLPDSNSNVAEYKKLKAQLAQGGNAADMEGEVFSHLVTFFSRYYDGGDFLSKRRYKENTYAIPYNGEEVKLHWANSDQYYIKTSEYFRNYTFVLPTSRKKVHFVLKDASTEQNNNRAANNMERRFALWEPENEGDQVIEVTAEGDLNIYFTYELMPKTTKQKDLMAAALEAITPLVPADFEEVLVAKAPTKDNPNRTLLEKHLTDYTAKNSFDYFIHKDLGGFLSRELDFYIKNEVLHIDDLDPQHINSQLLIVKAIKQVGQKIIQMLAQLENFQKKLWLKKKFVVQSDYCITLDRVPEKLYPEIIANEAQRKEWVGLFAIDEIKGDLTTEGYSEPLTIEFLKQNKFLVLDTAFFDAKFKHQLVKSMENIDEQTNGLLINSENFQALELLQEKFARRTKCVYIDPPYNAKSSEIMYKNTFKHASWLSLMENRINVARNLLRDDSVFEIAIDEVENARLCLLNDALLDFYSGRADVSIVINPSGQQGKNFSTSSEYVHFYFQDEPNMLAKEIRSEENADVRGFMNGAKGEGGNYLRTSGKTCFYPIYVKDNNVIGFGDVCEDDFHPISANVVNGDILEIYPIDAEGVERKWLFGRDTVSDIQSELSVKKNRNTGLYEIIRTKTEINYKTVWTDSMYSAKEHGTNLLSKMFKSTVFSFPKSLYAVKDCIGIAIRNTQNSLVLDFFAGSGTTGHAVIEHNRDNENANHKYVLCEMGDYFNSATRPRIEKALYSRDWRDGKPISRNGISQCFKYIRLEQYEDTLNNLEIKKQELEFQPKEFQESYMLSYLLDTETRDSLLNLKWFENPFEMTLKTTKDNELVETKVDMVETFNYLIGLNVETEDWYQDDNICVVQGKTHREGLKTLVIWRNCKVVNNDQLCMFFDKMDFRTRDTEFDLIYVNGDNTLPNLRRDEDHWKVVLTEEEFAKRMFEEN